MLGVGTPQDGRETSGLKLERVVLEVVARPLHSGDRPSRSRAARFPGRFAGGFHGRAIRSSAGSPTRGVIRVARATTFWGPSIQAQDKRDRLDRATSGLRLQLSPRRAGPRSTPSSSPVRGIPAAARTVGARSMTPTGTPTRSPRAKSRPRSTGGRITSGTRSVSSCTFQPCSKWTPCSPRLSPWSAVKTTSSESSLPLAASAEKKRSSWESR